MLQAVREREGDYRFSLKNQDLERGRSGVFSRPAVQLQHILPPVLWHIPVRPCRVLSSFRRLWLIMQATISSSGKVIMMIRRKVFMHSE